MQCLQTFSPQLRSVFLARDVRLGIKSCQKGAVTGIAKPPKRKTSPRLPPFLKCYFNSGEAQVRTGF